MPRPLGDKRTHPNARNRHRSGPETPRAEERREASLTGNPPLSVVPGVRLLIDSGPFGDSGPRLLLASEDMSAITPPHWRATSNFTTHIEISQQAGFMQVSSGSMLHICKYMFPYPFPSRLFAIHRTSPKPDHRKQTRAEKRTCDVYDDGKQDETT